MALNLTIRNPFKFNLLPERSLTGALTNTFNQAFYPYVGAGLTLYDYKGQTYIDKGYNENADVYSVISQISRKFASVPGLITDGDKEVTNPMPRPNYYQSESEYKELWETFMLLNGNAYQWILSPKDGANKGVPQAKFLLPSHLMQIVLKEDASFEGVESPISHYILVIGSAFIRFEAEDVIHSKFPNPNYDLHGSHLYGRSPIAAALLDIQTQNVTKGNNIKTMNNGGAYGFIHAADGQTPLNNEQAQQLKDRLIEMRAGETPLSQIAGASAKVGFTKISVDTKDLMPFEYLKYAQKQLCNVLGWSDKLLNNDEGAKYDNMDAAWKMSISNRIAPDLRIYEDGLNNYLYPRWRGKGYQVKFDVSELPEMQQDMKSLADWMVQLLDRGVVNRDEVRTAFKYSAIGTPEMLQYGVDLRAKPDAGAEPEKEG
jgi:HK97 family phage portal protein